MSLSNYFRDADIANIIATLNDVEKYEPLSDRMSKPENMAKVLDNLVDTIISEITDDPAEALYHHYSSDNLGSRFDRAEKDLIYQLAK
jgi:RNAse (barnase) inhibitor barstar